MYFVEYTPQAVENLKMLDQHTAAMLYAWVKKNLVDCDNPRIHGKGLTANCSSQWRYRIGDYRLIADISGKSIIILVLTVGRQSTYR